MVKDHSHSEKPHGYSFRLAAMVLYMHYPTDRITHTTAFVTPVVQDWLEREIAQWVHHKGSTRRPIAPCANVLTTSATDQKQKQK